MSITEYYEKIRPYMNLYLVLATLETMIILICRGMLPIYQLIDEYYWCFILIFSSNAISFSSQYPTFSGYGFKFRGLCGCGKHPGANLLMYQLLPCRISIVVQRLHLAFPVRNLNSLLAIHLHHPLLGDHTRCPSCSNSWVGKYSVKIVYFWSTLWVFEKNRHAITR